MNHPAISFGYIMLAGMIFFCWLGRWVAIRCNWQPEYGILVGAFLGVGYSGYELWKLLRVMNRDDDDQE